MAILTIAVAEGCDMTFSNKTDEQISAPEELSAAMDKFWARPQDKDNLMSIMHYITVNRDFAELCRTAEEMLDFARNSKEDTRASQVCLLTFLAQAYVFMDQFDNARQCIDTVNSPEYIKFTDDRLMVALHNSAAVMAIKTNLDYSLAMYHLRIAYEHALRNRDENNRLTILCNMAAIYYDRNDTAGMPYAHKVYNLAVKQNNREMKYYGQFYIAQFSILSRDFDTARSYADSIAVSAGITDNPARLSILNMLYGKISMETGDYTSADSIYRDLLEGSDTMEPSVYLELLTQYGDLKIRQKNYGDALTLFRTGLQESYANGSIKNRHLFLKGVSEAYSGLGGADNLRYALDYYRKYMSLTDSISLIQKERDFQQLLMSYEKEEKQKTEKRATLILFTCIIALIVLTSFIALYRQRMNAYKQRALNYQQYISRLTKMQHELETKNGSTGKASGNNTKQSRTVFPGEGRKLFDDIETLMNASRIYCRHDISLDVLSDLMKSNRAYISKVINKYSGMSFTAYINKKRIEAAAIRLSDINDDTPLKALADEVGYNSLSVFYRAFQKETGCSPSRFRDNIRKSFTDS